MPTEILPTHTAMLFAAAVRRAVELLRAGEVVALPTETVYGLAANALNATAVAKIFQVKGRPAHNPIIVHVADLALAKRCASAWPALAERLAHAFWPGPLTLVLPRSREIPDLVTAHGPTVGVRWPSHPFMQAVIRECGFPLAAPSANLSNRLSPTTAEHVRQQLADRIPLIVDGGPSPVGIESTVLDVTSDPPRILRPGMIHEASLAVVISRFSAPPTPTGNRQLEIGNPEEPLRSPGQLLKHYAPKAKLAVLEWQDDADLCAKLVKRGWLPVDCHVIAHSQIPSSAEFANVSVIPHDAEAYARALYAELHRCDATDAKIIVVEALPDMPEWRGIRDRLRRAATE